MVGGTIKITRAVSCARGVFHIGAQLTCDAYGVTQTRSIQTWRCMKPERGVRTKENEEIEMRGAKRTAVSVSVKCATPTGGSSICRVGHALHAVLALGTL